MGSLLVQFTSDRATAYRIIKGTSYFS